MVRGCLWAHPHRYPACHLRSERMPVTGAGRERDPERARILGGVILQMGSQLGDGFRLGQLRREKCLLRMRTVLGADHDQQVRARRRQRAAGSATEARTQHQIRLVLIPIHVRGVNDFEHRPVRGTLAQPVKNLLSDRAHPRHLRAIRHNPQLKALLLIRDPAFDERMIMTTTHTLPVVIVTGGSRGIGRETVETLARQGRGVLFTHSTSDGDAAQVEQACGTDAPVWGVRLDITDADAPARLFDLAESKGTAIALVNNAGVTGPLGPLTALPDDALRDIVEVNLVATARLCREAARRWSGRTTNERRDIVNVSSIAARTGAPSEYIVYAATKAAMDTLTVGLARELAPTGVHVNAVRAGTTNTTIHARAGDPDRPRRVADAVPMRRVAEPNEIAAAVSWLLSPEASYVNGALLDVAGGL